MTTGSRPVPGDPGVLRSERLDRHGRRKRIRLRSDTDAPRQSSSGPRQQGTFTTATRSTGTATTESLQSGYTDVSQQCYSRRVFGYVRTTLSIYIYRVPSNNLFTTTHIYTLIAVWSTLSSKFLAACAAYYYFFFPENRIMREQEQSCDRCDVAHVWPIIRAVVLLSDTFINHTYIHQGVARTSPVVHYSHLTTRFSHVHTYTHRHTDRLSLSIPRPSLYVL